MVKYCMNLSDEKKETAIKIALESKGNVRKRKIAVPLLMILGIVIIFSSIFLIINYICLFNYLFISSQMSAKPYFIGSTGILLLW